MSIKITGLDKLQRKLRRLEQNARRIDGTNSVPFTDLFGPRFMVRYTSYSTISDFLEASGYTVQSQADFEAIPESALDEHVRGSSRFSSWGEMLEAAGQEWIKGQLGL